MAPTTYRSANTSQSISEAWLTCSSCEQNTSSTSLFCVNELMKLVAFEPSSYITAAITFAPLALAILLSLWREQLVAYYIISAGNILYVSIALRLFPRKLLLILMAMSYGLVGLQRTHLGDASLGAIAVIVFFFLFGAMVLQRTYFFAIEKSGGLLVAVSSTSAVLTFYSLLMELAVVIHRFGANGAEWIDALYMSWFFWIWSARAILLCGALAAIAAKAAEEIIRRQAQAKQQSKTLVDHIVAQLLYWADTTYAWSVNVRILLLDTAGICVRMTVHFLIGDIIPAILVLASAYLSFAFAEDLAANILGDAPLPIQLVFLAVANIVVIFAFEYLVVASSLDRNPSKWPSLSDAARPFWKGAVTDARVLAFGLTYIIPMTAILLALVHFIGLHFGYTIGVAQFGFFTVSCLLLLSGMLAWGCWRRFARAD